jgi:uncharacterized membrane protein
MTFQILKVIHIMGATLLFGGGAGTALLLFRAYRLAARGEVSGELLKFALSHVIFVDWFFTLAAGVLQLGTGILLAMMAGYPFGSGWIPVSIALFGIVFILWAPAARLQMRMKKILVESGGALTPELHRALKIWALLGIPAFSGMVALFFLMVFRTLP